MIARPVAGARPRAPSLLAWLREAFAWLGVHPWVLLFPLSLPALWPFIAYGLPRSSDGENHLLRLGLLDTAIRHGIYYPRWMPEMLLGYGYPRFGFYAPGGYYFTEGLHLLGLSAYTAFILTFVAGLLLAGLGMYRLAADVLGENQRVAALAAGVAYLYAPFLITDTYMRGDFSEVLALGIMPWALWVARRLLRSAQPGRYLLAFALIVGGLALLHPLVLMLMAPVLGVYMLLHWWLSGRQTRVAGWAAVGLAAAMGISAFYWLPVVGERGTLATTGVEIARMAWLPGSAWRWRTFLDTRPAYDYAETWPVVRLGLVQVGLAIAGLALARRRDAEWLFFVGLAIVTGALMGQWALPLWRSSELLTSIQFMWRLLVLMSLPLALFAGGAAAPFRGASKTAAAALIVALVILAQRPRLAHEQYYAAQSVDLSAPVMAQWELERDALRGATGITSLQEFRPRWAGRTLTYSGEPVSAAANLAAIALRGNALDVTLDVQSEGGPLRFTSFYYPGWRVTANGRVLPTYPSTNLGLLTVDLPSGAQELSVTWAGTPLQHTGGAVSLVALGALAMVIWFIARRPGQALVPLALLGITVLLLGARPEEAVEAPVQPVESGGVRLIGYRAEQDGDYLYLFPYWLVTATPPDTWRARWELRDHSGRPVVVLDSETWYNTSPANNWAAGTVADDAYRLALPSSLPAGEYVLAVSPEAGQAAVEVGTVQLENPREPIRAPQYAADGRYADLYRLEGYDLVGGEISDRDAPFSAAVRAGDDVTYTLYWRAAETPQESVHGFLHLVDALGRPLAQEDHLPGPTFRPSRLWDEHNLQPDAYRLLIPEDAPGGLYWPAVGLYGRDLERLPARAGASDVPQDNYRLQPIKVVGRAARPEHRIGGRFGELAELTGYDLDAPVGGVRAGDTVTVTLHLTAQNGTGADYTRFVHLHDAGRGMAAQHDSPPQDGVNPTSAWLPGEPVHDTVTLRVSDDAAPGRYILYAGFYDPARGNTVLPAWDGRGKAVPDGRVPLGTLEIVP